MSMTMVSGCRGVTWWPFASSFPMAALPKSDSRLRGPWGGLSYGTAYAVACGKRCVCNFLFSRRDGGWSSTRAGRRYRRLSWRSRKRSPAFSADAASHLESSLPLQEMDFALVAIRLPLSSHLFGIHDGSRAAARGAAGRMDGCKTLGAVPSVPSRRIRSGPIDAKRFWLN